ncbi:MAG: Ig-like domain-containing protein [Gemmatimonadetes bacterium]|nr:Ig-like domain-containing protein [Gemmatimonadota bacterium]
MQLFLLLAALQQPQTPAAPAVPAPIRMAAPIARVVVEPAEAAVLVGDSIRLKATAYDSAGRVFPEVTASWFAAGPRSFEGEVTSDGLVKAGAVGTISVSVLVRPKGGGRSVPGTARVTILPPPASRVALAPAPATLYAGQSLVIRPTVYAPTGDLRKDQVLWTSDRPTVVAVSGDGRVTARAAGKATLTATAGRASERLTITVLPNPATSVAVEPATTTVRTGDVVPLKFLARAGARTLDNVAVEWLMGAGTGAEVDADGRFVAALPGTYRVTASFAGKTAEAVITATPRDVRRPTTLVGRVPLKFMAAEFWLHPDGKHGYITTIGDRAYAIDLSNPANPVITDSVVVDARVINDLMTTEDGKYGVLTREGGSSRQNGIVVLSFEDPAHPKPIANFTETVSGGVHSTFIYRGYVYLTDDATGSLRVVDIRDPYHPRQVARWQPREELLGNYVHDVDVQDGLAYLSYWNDGLIILDVGNGIKGGSPENPVFVSQTKYDLDAIYREVEAQGGPGFIRGTHTAWRHGNYVFVGDEVFSARPRPTEGVGPMGLGRAWGRLHVVDVSDLTSPKVVAHYEPKDGGVHNVWVAGDTLYLGNYQGGLRVLDISGELRGDLLAQGREIAHVITADKQGMFPNAPMAWGAIYRDGMIYVPDMHNGLFIVKVEGKSQLTP